eukprot:426813-Pyramimonas_sp.AAC.1
MAVPANYARRDVKARGAMVMEAAEPCPSLAFWRALWTWLDAISRTPSRLLSPQPGGGHGWPRPASQQH